MSRGAAARRITGMYAVILAGGGGTRLWPLSRPDRPKPFLPLLGERTLLRATFDRVRPLLDGPGDVVVVVDRRHVELVREELPEVPPGNVLAEPTGRNTAAAIALAAVAFERPADEAMAVLPADHLVLDEDGFRAPPGAGGRGRRCAGSPAGDPRDRPDRPRDGLRLHRRGRRPARAGRPRGSPLRREAARRRGRGAPGRSGPGRLERGDLRLAPRHDPGGPRGIGTRHPRGDPGGGGRRTGRRSTRRMRRCGRRRSTTP